MARNESYEKFVDKFKPKHTTYDCYTPVEIYDAVAGWVEREYRVNRCNFVRPFYPGGDYENYDYDSGSSGSIVVDNPPFSIFSKILDFYINRDIPFFLFAPNLTLFSAIRNRNCSAIVVDSNITYQNGAIVHTSFATNLESDNIRIRTAPTLYQAIQQADEKIRKQTKKQLPKYSFPNSVVRTPLLNPYSRYGIEIRIPFDESYFIRQLDSQKESKKAIFGGGFLVSDKIKAQIDTAEREKAEREKVTRWVLSDAELEMISKMSK